MAASTAHLQNVLQPLVEDLGYEWVGCEWLGVSRAPVLRVYIDQPGGVSIDTCASVSREIAAVLDVDACIASAYSLEVSSPGLDRPLLILSQYKKSVGQMVQLVLKRPMNGQKKWRGFLKAVTDDQVTVEVEGVDCVYALTSIAKAHVVFQYN